ncbi:COG4315 family predicted lipoprotein [Mesorhizobium sp. RIZ17]|uniref:COG4315 family predicted lipoprotein n=1 Tax=Mesorhizobium sp. RIZ17 TaxID=3132743 RepID=UPI003DA986D6
MKSIALGFAALLLGTVASHAAQAWKEAEVGGTKIYTDAKGMTLYTFDKDEKGKSTCYDKCAANWPPLKAEAGAKPDDEWTVIDRTDGSKMWAYDGKPVYTFVKDKKAGDMAGEGVAGAWHVVKAD